MSHVLIHLSPLYRCLEPVREYPHIRSVGNPNEWVAPDGYAYIPDLPKPDYNYEVEECERLLTTDVYGWQVRPLTEEEIEARKPSDAVSTISALGRKFTEQVPEQFQPELSGLFAEVRVLIEADMPHLAKAAILRAQIPPELEPLRQPFADMISLP